MNIGYVFVAADPGDGWGHMGGDGWSGWMWLWGTLMMLLWIAVIGAAAWLIVRVAASHRASPRGHMRPGWNAPAAFSPSGTHAARSAPRNTTSGSPSCTDDRFSTPTITRSWPACGTTLAAPDACTNGEWPTLTVILGSSTAAGRILPATTP